MKPEAGDLSPAFFLFSSFPRFVAIAGAAVCAWMVSALPAPWAWEIRYDDARVLQLVAMIAVAMGLAIRPDAALGPWRCIPRWARGVTCGCFLVGALSAGLAAYPAYAITEWVTFAGLILLGLTVASVPASSFHRTAMLLLVVVGALVLGWRLVVELVAVVVTSDATGLQSSWIDFLNPRYFAKVTTWLIPLLWFAGYAARQKSRAITAFCFVVASVLAAHILMTGSRGALLALVVSAGVCAVAFGSPGRRLAVAIVLYCIVGAAIWGAVEWIYGGASFSGIARTGSSDRNILAQQILAAVRQSPWWGIGPMQFADLERHAWAAAPHNSVLQLAAEWGLPATVGFIGLALAWLRFYLLKVRSAVRLGAGDDGKGWEVAVFAAILAAFGQSLIANVLSDPISQTLLAVFIGAASQSSAPVEDAGRGSRWARGLSMRVLALAVAVGLVLGLMQGQRCVGMHVQMAYTPGFDGRIWPRYWSQGFIPLERTCTAALPAK